MSWWILALLGALVWGIHYPLVAAALDKISLVSVLLLTTLPMIIIGPLFYKTLADDYQTFITLSLTDKFQIAAIMLTSISATIFVFMAIGSKNATLASLIEITYPVFVALFAMLILKENHMSPNIIIGGLCIFIGVSIIIYGQNS